MKHLFKPEVTKALWSLLILVLFVKIVWFAVEIVWLPAIGVQQSEDRGSKALYYRVKLGPNEAPAPTTDKKPLPVTESIRDIKLLAIYNASDVTVVTVEYKRKTEVLARGESINGFVLEGAGIDYAVFSKNDKNYQVNLIVSKKGEGSITAAQRSPGSDSSDTKIEGEVVDAGDHKIIDKSLVDHFSKNIDDVYKDIGIKEIRNGKKVEGFSISFIRKGSPFAQLGIQRGDVIKTINGQKIDSHKAAFDIYRNILNIDNLTLVIQRGKEEMELEYEVN